MIENTITKSFKFHREFASEAKCLEFLFKLRFGHLKFCPNPKCKQPMDYKPTRGRRCWNCKFCYFKLYPGANTILHSSSLPLTTWFRAIHFIASSRKGVTGHELARNLEVHHTTGHRMLIRILQNLDYNLPNKLTGRIECDEAYFGKSKGHRGRNNDKHIIFCMVQRNGDAIAKHVPDTTSETLLPIIAEHVHKSATIYTDQYSAYKRLSEYGFNKHFRIKHSIGQYAKGHISSNLAENFWSRLKSHLKNNTHVKHIQYYINLAQFQHRHRKVKEQAIPMLVQLFKPVNEG